MDKSNCFLLVYGSETGQAQSIAEQIAEKSPEFGLQANLHCLDKTDKGFNIEDEKCMVMVTSTTGDGDAPDNASKFLRRIKKKTLASDYLSHLHYAILGLGDTNYNNFCKCPRDMDSRLEQLGAKRFYPTGLADDGVGLEIVADPWLEGLYPALRTFLGLSNGPRTSGSLYECLATMAITEEKSSGNTLELPNSFGKEELSVCDNIQVECGSASSVNSTVSGGLVESNTNRTTELNSKDSLTLCTNNGIQAVPTDDLGLSCDKLMSNVKETPCVRIVMPDVEDLLSGAIRESCPLLANKDLTVPVLPPQFLEAHFSHQVFETRSLSFQNDYKLPSAASDITQAQITSARVLTQPGASKKTLLLQLNVMHQEVKVCPGDSISVICENSGSEVQLLLKRLKATDVADQQMPLSIIPDTKKRRAAIPPYIHPTSTLRHVFKTCVNIRDPPSKAFLRALIEYTTVESEVRRLQELCSKEGTEDYSKCLREKHVSLLDLLYAFPSCQPPVERILEFLPRLQPRPYSVCSCPETNVNSMDIAFNVVDVPGSIEDGHYYNRRGVCTGWLDDISTALQENGSSDSTASIKVPIFFRSNQHFRPPDDLSRPLILIGPGTGVSPFIGFLQQRALFKDRAENGDKYAETWLFFGCRNKGKDYIFQSEMEAFLASGALSRLCVSFSRDLNSSHRYVQDYMKSESASLARLLVQDNPLIYVCGDAKHMAVDVNAAFQNILVTEKGLSADEANAFMMKKRLHKTYLEDVWV